MNDNRLTKKLIQLICGITIWAIMTALWAFMWYKNYADVIALPFYRRGNWVVIGIYGILLFLLTHFYGGYRVGFYRRGDIIFSGIIAMALTNGITYLQTGLLNRDLINLNPFPFLRMSLLDFIFIWIWATAANRLYLWLNPPRHLLLVYGGEGMAQTLVLKMAQRDDRYIISQSINIDQGLLAVLDLINDYQAILICDVKSSHRNRLLKYCYRHGIRVYMTPKISDILIRGADSIHLFDSPLLLTRSIGLTQEQRFCKRIVDIFVSALGLLAAAPLMAVIALAIKLGDKGPALYRQTRLTRDGREFSLLKFRSMVVDAERSSGAQLSNKGDTRITPIGRLIRKLRLDELPQLYNILRGDMSLVGPRPERPEIAAEYRQTIEEFDLRLKVKAGLTGYAQVLGKYNTTPYDKLKLDLMYITGYSLLLDLKLLLMTIKIIFMTESTEGIPETALTAQPDQPRNRKPKPPKTP